MSFKPEDHDFQEIVGSPTKWSLLRLLHLPRLPVSSSIVTAVVCLVVLVIWLASGILSNPDDKIEMAKAINTGDGGKARFKVTVRRMQASSFANRITLQAHTEADRIVTISAETGGTIKFLPVDKGALVQAGQVLCGIDVGARKAQLDQARASRDARKIDYIAARDLHKKGHVPKSRLASTRAAYDGAIAEAKTRQVELARTEIKAPFDGILDKLPVKVGQFMSIGQPCATIIDKDPLLIVAHVSENQIQSVTMGARGEATLTTGEKVEGFIRYVAESPNMATRTFRIELEVENKDFALRDGVSAELMLNTGDALATRVPQSILTLGDTGKIGVRVVEDGSVVFRPVNIISDDVGGAVVIGLKPEENVIIRGGEYTRDGRQVEFEFEPQPDVGNTTNMETQNLETQTQ